MKSFSQTVAFFSIGRCRAMVAVLLTFAVVAVAKYFTLVLLVLKGVSHVSLRAQDALLDGAFAAGLVALLLAALRDQRRDFEQRNRAVTNLYQALKVIVAEDTPEPERSKALWSIVRDFPAPPE